MAEETILVLSTFPDATSAKQVAQTLVEEHLAACVNILPQMESLYRWEGRIEQATEVLCLIKTTVGRYLLLENRIKQLHPYELPEVIAVNLQTGLPAYLQWAVDCCNAPRQKRAP